MCAKYASEGTEEKQRADAEDTRPQTSPSDARTVTESHNAEQQISLWPSGNARGIKITLAPPSQFLKYTLSHII